MPLDIAAILPGVGIYAAGVLSHAVVKSFAAGRSWITRQEVELLLKGYMPRESLAPELDTFRRDVARLEATMGRLEERLNQEAARRRDHTGSGV